MKPLQPNSEAPAQAGFTILEVLIAMVVMAIGLVGLLGMSSQAARLAINNTQWTNARMLAQSALESRTSEDFDTLQAEAASTPYESQTMNYDGKSYQIEFWHRLQGGSRDPIEITVRVSATAADPVSLTTVKTFYL